MRIREFYRVQKPPRRGSAEKALSFDMADDVRLCREEGSMYLPIGLIILILLIIFLLYR